MDKGYQTFTVETTSAIYGLLNQLGELGSDQTSIVNGIGIGPKFNKNTVKFW